MREICDATYLERSNMDSNPNSEGDVREADGLNLVGISGGSSMCCPPGGVAYKHYKPERQVFRKVGRVRCSV